MNQRKIEWIIVFFTVVLVCAVVTVGYITFGNLKKIEHQTERISEPNRTILNLKLVISELRNSESNVYSYNLYKNEEYLLSYHHSLELIDEYFDSLYFYQKDEKNSQAIIDSIRFLTEQKFLLLNEHLNLRNDEKLLGELNRINVKLDSIKLIDTLNLRKTNEAIPKKKKGFFSRLFKAKQKPDTTNYNKLLTDSINAITKRSVNDVKTEVKQVKVTQARQLDEMKSKELDLIARDNSVMSHLLSLINELEKKQNEKLKTIARENIDQTVKTNNFIRIFGSLILLLMLSLIAFSLFYLYRSKQYRNKLKEAAKVARELAKSKEYFLATMSHEIRTPLNAIVGFSEQLLQSPLNEEQQNQSKIIHSSSNHLLEIVNDVLDFSKIEAEKISLEEIPFNPRKQVWKAIQLLNQKALEKNLEVRFTESKDIPHYVIGDPLRLRQIMLNLLSNAIKFTPKGHISVTLATKSTGEKNKILLTASVVDTGIGIAPSRIETIFESFTQADNSITRKYGGTGLGLSITKRLIDLQKGTIFVNSELNKGTSIAFEIPYLVDTKGTIHSHKGKLPVENKLAGTKLLIADDEVFNRVLISTIAKKYGMAYDEVENGAEALEMIRKNQYDVVLMDVRMPEISGMDAAVLIRQMADKTKAGVPIIALTATSSPEKKEKYIRAGMNEVLTKPFKEQDLLSTIENLLFNV
jgi:signal transduction histidine kinase/CheY-like chemotaxis protein